jgi:stearoyl-CoA desaturase (delta-9 desaturase)
MFISRVILSIISYACLAYVLLFAQHLLLFAIPIFIIGAFAASGYLHRSIAHRTWFLKSKFIERILLSWSVMSGIGTPLGWVVVHRMHHRNLDTELDFHSPQQIGFLRSFFHLWTVDESKVDRRLALDLLKNKDLVFFHKYHLYLLPVYWVIFFIIGGVAGCISLGAATALGLIGYGVANAVFHKKGNGDIIDYKWLSWLNFGENFHSYHHAFPGSYRFTGTGWDPAADIIDWLVKNNFAEFRK